MYTDKIRNAPVQISRNSAVTPVIIRPLLIMEIVIVPTIVFITDPTPPASEAPPIATAVIHSKLYAISEVGTANPIRQPFIIPAIAANVPETANTKVFIFLTGIRFS